MPCSIYFIYKAEVNAMKKFYLIAILWLIIASAPFAAAEPPMTPPGHLHHIWKNEDDYFSKLDLTEKQKEKIAKLRENLRKDTEILRSQRYEMIAEMRLLWIDPDSDSDKIMSRAKNFHNHMWKLVEKDFEYRIGIRGILTREQYSKFIDLGGFR